MCKGNYVFNPGDIVRRKVMQDDSGWVATIKTVESNLTTT